jgi:mannose-6-phosphate isomerase
MVRQLKPQFVAKPEWGSNRLSPWFADRAEKIGEVWFRESQADPLLVKFLFTTGKLSVQVHPPDEYAREHHQSRGKTEMWHVLAAEPGAQIAAGLSQPVSKEQLRSAALSGEIEQMLTWYDARPGDTFFLPAGTIHAIGPGLALFEIQENSELTYRLYDYGRPRELHLDHALAVSHRGPYDPRRAPREGVLVDCPYFCTEKLHVKGSLSLNPAGTIVMLEGQAVINGESSRAGDVWRGLDAAHLTGSATLLRILTSGS